MVLGLGVLIVEADEDRDIVNATLFVDECPHIQMEENAPKYRLLGVWYAYATTPLPFQHYQRRCASYNVRNSSEYMEAMKCLRSENLHMFLVQPTLRPTFSIMRKKKQSVSSHIHANTIKLSSSM